MFSVCGACHGHIQGVSLSILCSGICDKRYHLTCVNVPADVHKYLDMNVGLCWKCPDCMRKCFCVDSENLNTFLQEKFNDCAPVKYADIIKNKSKPAVIIEPKNVEQNSQQTKSHIASTIKPSESVGCSSTEDNSRFKKIAQEKLADSYIIKEVKGIYPRVKIVGITEKYSSEDLEEILDHVIRINSDIFDPNSVCKVLKFWPTKKKPNVYQAILQVDKISYDRLISSGGLFVGYDYCYTFDAVELNRCFNCNSLGHSSYVCTQKICCPRCSGDHNVKNCIAANLKCINCVKSAEKDKTTLDTGHAAWDTRCPTYLKALEKLKRDLLMTYDIAIRV
ncbi:uncharacterized protein LOC135128936 isoform X2 [Zophobas morio]|uniref:uncharacterized protein LOC135128936 isoform X2 n=1 Tax=Zophobas morio TaxID=2755281 RepID=UPI0030833DB8